MDQYVISLTVIGFAALTIAWMPGIMSKFHISYSIFYLALGVLLYSLPIDLPWPDPLWKQNFTVHLTELVIIISLMGTGLKIDHPFNFKEWRNPFRLITITMLLCIAIIAFLAWWALGFDPASAVLLGAVLAPTDPVLAADVQVGPPNEEKNDQVRFSLTAEAGLNDGMAFPFTWLAVAIALGSQTGDGWLLDWVWKDLIYRIVAGVAIGFLLGKALAYLLFYLPEKKNFTNTRDGFVAISTTLFVYGLTELAHGYGFVAVFVTAITLRSYESKNEYHKELHSFTDQIERILLVVLLILFGGSLIAGILDSLNWGMALLGLAFLFLIRPVTGLLGLGGSRLSYKQRMAISFFGIRGIGSFFYLSFGLSKAEFVQKEEIWSLVAFIVLVSIIVHGVSASYIMNRLGLHLPDNPKEKAENI